MMLSELRAASNPHVPTRGRQLILPKVFSSNNNNELDFIYNFWHFHFAFSGLNIVVQLIQWFWVHGLDCAAFGFFEYSVIVFACGNGKIRNFRNRDFEKPSFVISRTSHINRMLWDGRHLILERIAEHFSQLSGGRGPIQALVSSDYLSKFLLKGCIFNRIIFLLTIESNPPQT